MLTEGRNQGEKLSSDHARNLTPVISIQKGGGAIRGLGEKFATTPVTGTGSLSVPIYTSPGRSGFGPVLSLSYDSATGNGPFGFGWNLALPAISRKTDKGLPKYQDETESDVFIFSGTEDLVPVLPKEGQRWKPERIINGISYRIKHYRPRIEGMFARIERWTNKSDPNETFWRSISKDNITSWYGKTDNSRITDPSDASRIFSWLICESYDDKGNLMVYEYKKENSIDIELSQANERNRTEETRSANRYLKSIKYGNRTPFYPILAENQPPTPVPEDWLFEVVLDFGEHDLSIPTPDDPNDWECRKDPFSSYRAGFEIRTYRLCKRVLMFHNFPSQPEVGVNCLVRSTDFTYSYVQDPTNEQKAFFSHLLSVKQTGYKRKPDNTYIRKSLPPIEFEYSQATINEELHTVDPESLENLPSGVDGTQYMWVDLDGEGLTGILSEQGNGWFYKRNLSPAKVVKEENCSYRTVATFGPTQLLSERPSQSVIHTGRQQFLDLEGDGQLDLVDFQSPMPGFYERMSDQNWKPFRPFDSLPVIDWDDPNVKFIDLTGDGQADILISKDDVFYWYPSLGEEGFGASEVVSKVLEEEKGPRIVFADGTQSIYLADMSGDGLSDIVRICNGEVCYWPNLGYGRFGTKVTMDNSPCFDHIDLFNQRRIHLADIDGTGVTDIIYAGAKDIRLYFNQSGNSWSEARALTQFPLINAFNSMAVVDLLGNGTACLVYSSPLPGDSRQPMKYVDLMGGQKPHLLTKVINNLGAETRVKYVPSTKFYLEDELAGKPWITRLPFPVHVVERVETYDWISRNRFVTRYAYHHGYFDGHEREFRGFGMVEQWDTEEFAIVNETGDCPHVDNLDAASHVPPTLTRTWFHTGAYLEGSDIFNRYENEYYRESDHSEALQGLTNEQLKDMLLEKMGLELPKGVELSPEEEREAVRALKGTILRQEIYGLDGSKEQDHPFHVSEYNYTIQLLQSRGENKHAVFFTYTRETVDFHYERKLFDINRTKVADPRVSHTMVLKVDDYGNVEKSVAIGYGRRYNDPNPLLTDEDRKKQKQILATLKRNQYTVPIPDDDDVNRTPLLCETRSYELLNLATEVTTSANAPKVTNLFRFKQIRDQVWEIGETGGAQENHPNWRLIKHARTLYRPNDLGIKQGNPMALLPLGQLESMALPGESYQLAFTPSILTDVYQRNGESLVQDSAKVMQEGGYVSSSEKRDAGLFPHDDPDDHWWVPSGRVFYSPNNSDDSSAELAYARLHFFLNHRYRDPFGSTTQIRYDSPYNLLLLETEDELHNKVTAGERNNTGDVTNWNDYRVLQPKLVTDANGNRTAVAYDTLGMITGTAVMGKSGENKGDLLTDFKEDLEQGEVDAFFANPKGDIASSLLGTATTRVIYDVNRFTAAAGLESMKPVYAATISRETHVSDLLPGQQSKLSIRFSYSDGLGRVIQNKIQAEPGQLVDAGAVIDSRWVGSGWIIFNNKGNPVKKYEPFFDDTHEFRFGKKEGVSPILFYDSVERVVATLHPNHTYEKIVFDPWQQATWDVNDTLNPEQRFDPRFPHMLPDHFFDPASDPDVGGYFKRLNKDEYLPTWYNLRMDPSKANAVWPDVDPVTGAPQPKNKAIRDAEKKTAEKSARHSSTPSFTFLDTLGRPFLTVMDNGLDDSGANQFYITRFILDIEGNQREVVDAKGRIIMRYHYDLLGNRIHQASMEAGERWMINDVKGKQIRAWDSRGHEFQLIYDQLRRPIETYLLEGNGQKALVDRTVYGETLRNPEINNLRGKVIQHYDQAGVATSDVYDFKGNLLRSQRQLAKEYKRTLDWMTEVALETEIYTSRTRHDAFNRPTELISPDNSVIRPIYNEANLLERVEANLRGEEVVTLFVTDIQYNARGQRTRIDYATRDGKGFSTSYTYDPITFRLAHMITKRSSAHFDATDRPGELQNLKYTYDPVGNITFIRDDAQQTIYFRNRRVEPSSEYTYDAIYRLVEATGREHLGQPNSPTPPDPFNDFHTHLQHPGDGNSMGTYVERYLYDSVGNILSMQHRGSTPEQPGWTRTYDYNESSQLESGKVNNRLSATTLAGITNTYHYDGTAGLHGNMTTMPHLPLMQWDYRDQLQATAQQVVNNGGTPEMTWYVYDTSGLRVRKVTESQAAAGQLPTRLKERIYLDGFEIYREYEKDGVRIKLERETLHVMDDKQRVALIETQTIQDQSSITNPESLIRYQLGNHLGSVSLELDENAAVITYEEYTPYGSTAYCAGRSLAEVSLKRYRYTGKERDEENGLNYHGARYYASWLGKWVSCDPLGIADGPNLYGYVRANPISRYDLTGTTGTDNDNRTETEIAESIKNRTGGQDPKDLILKYYGPREMTMRELEARLTTKGILRERIEETKKPPVMDEVLEPHGVEGRFVNRARVGSEESIAQAKEAGKQELIESQKQVITAMAGARKGKASEGLVKSHAAVTGQRTESDPKPSTPTPTKPAMPSTSDTTSSSSGSNPKSATFRRWQVGDPHDAPTAAGREPSWKTVRERYWKNRAASAKPGEFTPADLENMKRGKPPLDPVSGKPMELEHVKPQRSGDPDRHRDLMEVSPLEHSFFDRYRYVADPDGRRFETWKYDKR